MEGYRVVDGCLESCPKNEENIVIPDGVTSLKKYLFIFNCNIKSVVIPDGVISIGNKAFYECFKLTEIVIPNSVKKLGDYAFFKCISLKKLPIPEKVTRLGKFSFSECDSLENVVIPKNVKRIGEGSFCSCSSLKTIVIPDTVIKIGKDAFCYCPKLKKITIRNLNLIDDSIKKYAVLGLPEIYSQCTEEEKEAYLIYIRENIAIYRKSVIKNIELLSIFINNNLIPPEAIDSFIEEANNQQNIQATAMLLSYKRKQNSL